MRGWGIAALGRLLRFLRARVAKRVPPELLRVGGVGGWDSGGHGRVQHSSLSENDLRGTAAHVATSGGVKGSS
jgi:hypothetical protein